MNRRADVRQYQAQQLTRRAFLGRGTQGLGVLSLATLQQTLVRMIERGIATATRRRQRPADFLAGLPRVPKSAMTMDWELALAEDETPEESDLDI